MTMYVKELAHNLVELHRWHIERIVALDKRITALEGKVMGIPPQGIRVVEDVVDITANGDQEPKTLIVKRPAIGEDKQ